MIMVASPVQRALPLVLLFLITASVVASGDADAQILTRESLEIDRRTFRADYEHPIVDEIFPLDRERDAVLRHFRQAHEGGSRGRTAADESDWLRYKSGVRNAEAPILSRETPATSDNAEADPHSRLTDTKDFCFISIGCWGGIPPQSRSQRLVSEAMTRLIRASYKQARSTPDEFIPPRPVRFVLAAGDNMYKHGVKNVEDSRFFTTFEYLYGWKDALVRRVPWFVAQGNHDYRGNFTAQVNYTFLGPKRVSQYNTQWSKDVDAAAKQERDFWQREAHAGHGTAAITTTEQETHSMDTVTGRWFAPATYYVRLITEDTALFVIDTPLLERCHNNGHTHSRCWDGGQQKAIVEKWLLEDYAHIPVKIVMGHYPIMSNGPHVNFEWLVSWTVPLFEQACVSMYINADNHYVQVSQSPSTAYITSGGGSGLSLHKYLAGKSWLHTHSVFHSIEFGPMMHCRVGNEMLNYVFSENAKELFRFRTWPSSGEFKASNAQDPSVVGNWSQVMAPTKSLNECLARIPVMSHQSVHANSKGDRATMNTPGSWREEANETEVISSLWLVDGAWGAVWLSGAVVVGLFLGYRRYHRQRARPTRRFTVNRFN